MAVVALTRRRRGQLSRGLQYAAAGLALVLVAVFADWGRVAQAFLDVEVAAQLFPAIFTTALKNTLVYTACGFSFGLALGLLLALMRLSPVGPYRWFANGFIELFRGLPALVVFIAFGYGLPIALQVQVPGGVLGTVTVALGLVGGAYMAETIRAGILAVPRGQMEAARSLGMSHTWAMVSIVIPQAFRIVLPPLTNELILLTKDSSLVYLLGLTLETQELTKYGRDALSQYVSMTPILAIGLCYLTITVPLSALVRRLEARNARAR
ncbi:MAG: amino acid ABC transporter permease [Carbonactinosporaceae bacterium]